MKLWPETKPEWYALIFMLTIVGVMVVAAIGSWRCGC